MEIFGKALIIFLVLFIFVFAVMAIIRGIKGMKMSKNFDAASKKMKIGYLVVSAIHMWSGILIVLCYLAAVILFFVFS